MRTIFLLLALAGIASAQSIPTVAVTVDPSGSCTNERLQFNTVNGKLWGCSGGTWATASGGGSPTGAAGGQLSGTYPNPGFANPATFPGNVQISNTVLGADGSIQGTNISTPSGASGTQPKLYPKGGKWCQYDGTTETCIGTGSANAVLNNQANTYSTGLQDFSGASIKLPSAVTVGANSITFPGVAATLATLGSNAFTGNQSIVGTTTTPFTVNTSASQSFWQFLYSSGTSGGYIGYTTLGATGLGILDNSGSHVRLQVSGASGNVLIGQDGTDGNYRLDVQKSGSTGTVRVGDQTATTGATRVLFSLGAADSTSTNIFTVAGGSTHAGKMLYTFPSFTVGDVVCYKTGGELGHAAVTGGTVGSCL